MSKEQTAEEIEALRKDIIERTAKNIPTKVHEDYIKLQIRIALNNYAVPFEKLIQEQAKEIESLNSELDNIKIESSHEIADLVKEIERLKGQTRLLLIQHQQLLDHAIAGRITDEDTDGFKESLLLLDTIRELIN